MAKTPLQADSACANPVPSAEGISPYLAELDAIDARARELEVGHHTEAEWDHWEKWTDRIYRGVEALPPTPDNAGIKARAIWSITDGELDVIVEGEATVCRLARQVLTGLTASVSHVSGRA